MQYEWIKVYINHNSLNIVYEAAPQPQGLAAPDLGAAGHPCMHSIQ